MAISLEQLLQNISAGGVNFTDVGGISSGQGLDFDTMFGDFGNSQSLFNSVLPLFIAKINAASSAASSAASGVISSNQTGSQLATAGINANAQIGIAQANIEAELIALEETIRQDIVMANKGFKFNVDQHNSNLRRQAELSNANKSVEIAQLAGSGQARDQIARMLAIQSGGETPGAFSAFSGLPSPFLDPTAGQIDYTPIPEFGGIDRSGFNFNFPTFDTSFTPQPMPTGGFGGGGFDLASIFAEIQGLMGFGGGNFGPTIGSNGTPTYNAPGAFGPTVSGGSAPGAPGGNFADMLKKLGITGFARGTKGQRPTKGIVGDSTDGKPNPEMVIAPGGFQVIPMKNIGKSAKGVRRFAEGTDRVGGTNNINLFGQDFPFNPDISDIDLLKGPLKSLLDLPILKEFGQGFSSTEAPAPTPIGNFTQRKITNNPTGAMFAGIPNLFQGAARFAQTDSESQGFISQFLEFLGISQEQQTLQQNAANPGFSFSPKRALSFF